MLPHSGLKSRLIDSTLLICSLIRSAYFYASVASLTLHMALVRAANVYRAVPEVQGGIPYSLQTLANTG